MDSLILWKYGYKGPMGMLNKVARLAMPNHASTRGTQAKGGIDLKRPKKFDKRLKTYLKRYGLSKVKAWSYLSD